MPSVLSTRSPSHLWPLPKRLLGRGIASLSGPLPTSVSKCFLVCANICLPALSGWSWPVPAPRDGTSSGLRQWCLPEDRGPGPRAREPCRARLHCTRGASVNAGPFADRGEKLRDRVCGGQGPSPRGASSLRGPRYAPRSVQTHASGPGGCPVPRVHSRRGPSLRAPYPHAPPLWGRLLQEGSHLGQAVALAWSAAGPAVWPSDVLPWLPAGQGRGWETEAGAGWALSPTRPGSHQACPHPPVLSLRLSLLRPWACH